MSPAAAPANSAKLERIQKTKNTAVSAIPKNPFPTAITLPPRPARNSAVRKRALSASLQPPSASPKTSPVAKRVNTNGIVGSIAYDADCVGELIMDN
jgi:hypothetical protein